MNNEESTTSAQEIVTTWQCETFQMVASQTRRISLHFHPLNVRNAHPIFHLLLHTYYCPGALTFNSSVTYPKRQHLTHALSPQKRLPPQGFHKNQKSTNNRTIPHTNAPPLTHRPIINTPHLHHRSKNSIPHLLPPTQFPHLPHQMRVQRLRLLPGSRSVEVWFRAFFCGGEEGELRYWIKGIKVRVWEE